jgi:hypothetical protein
MYKTIAKNEQSYYRKLGYFGVGIFWQFSVKMWMFNFWCFSKDACYPEKVFVFRPYPIS